MDEAETLARDCRQRMAQRLAELHRLHLALAADTRALKRLTLAGRAEEEATLAAELLEGYLSATGAFLENMRGRFEARLPLIRRGEPQRAGRAPEEVPGHGGFWLAFSRLCAVLRRAERRAGS